MTTSLETDTTIGVDGRADSWRQRRGRHHLSYLVMLFAVVTFGALAASAAGQGGYPENLAPIQPTSGSGTGVENPCRPVMDALTARDPNLMVSTGLDDTIPGFLADGYTPGGLYCLSDDLAGRVDAVYVEFWRGGSVAVTWLSASSATETYDWVGYLASLERGRSRGNVIALSRNEYLAVSGIADVASIRSLAQSNKAGPFQVRDLLVRLD